MKKQLLFLLMLSSQLSLAQKQEFSGKIVDANTTIAISGATISMGLKGTSDISDEQGVFHFQNIKDTSSVLSIFAFGYEPRQLSLSSMKSGAAISLKPVGLQLRDVVITANGANPYKPISETDIRMRGVSNAQEVLRLIPGLFIGQHQGGGKAEQIFLRGFDNDHGTDISLQVDGMPINLVSHAHGQGYSDSHFIIPETIGNTTFKKGSADPEKGNLVTAGFAEFHTLDALERNVFRVEGGQFNTFRGLAMVNLLNKDALAKGHSWYTAAEYRYSDSYFEHPQHFNRINLFSKYHGTLTDNSTLSISASTFYSDWKASGQIPDYAVNDGTIGFFGALDPNEGGVTSRTNINALLLTTTPGNNLIKNQLFYSRYALDLHSNFTFFLEDPVNGDEIRQREGRDMFGYNGSYTQDNYLGNMKLSSKIGLNVRLDATQDSELSHTKDNNTLLQGIKLGDITELNTGIYLSERLQFTEQFSLDAGVRFDQFYYRYYNKLDEDLTLDGAGAYKAHNNVVSPKLSFYFQPNAKTQFYLTAGKGFHSNDTRGVVAAAGLRTLPSAYTTDLGTVMKISDKLLINAAVWQISLSNEYVYSGDGGSIEFSGKTQRLGADFSARYQPLPAIYLDADVNYARGRAVDEPKGENYIPLAPVWTSAMGITYMNKTGLNGSIRSRYLADRPANEDYSLTAAGYFITDLVLNYTWKRSELGITVNNLFDVRWKETQFETLTRLRNREAVNSIAFTPGSKFAALAHFSYFF